MSWTRHDDECPGCRPALYDMKAQRSFGPESPEMQAVDAIWAETTKQEREAFHRATCQNSRLPSDLRLVEPIVEKIQRAVHELVKKRIPHTKDPA